MYVVYEPNIQLNAKNQKVIEICRNGGYVKYQLEKNYFGQEKFQIRVYDLNGDVVKGFGYKAIYNAIASGILIKKEIPNTSAYATIWAI